MPRIGLLNMVVGFIFIFLSASAGFFLATEHTRIHIRDNTELLSWWVQLSASAHGHTNLFGMLHILFGLTFPYSVLNLKTKVIQSIGLLLGSFAMSILMFIRALSKPNLEYDALGIVTGVFLSAALISIVLQIFGLMTKCSRIS